MAGKHSHYPWYNEGGKVGMTKQNVYQFFISLTFIITISALPVFSFTEDTVMFYSDSLGGTLAIPSGPGPFPAIILVHGTGEQNRDYKNSGEKYYLDSGKTQSDTGTMYAFRDISNYLASHGIAVFRYDKRSNTYPEYAPYNNKDMSPYLYIEDIKRAVQYVKSRAETDPSRIMLLGHSEGCNFTSIVARDGNDIAALVSIGAAALPVDSIAVDQKEYLDLDSVMAGVWRAQFQQLRAGSWPTDSILIGRYPTYWRDWIDITDSAAINYNGIQTPALFLHGKNDFFVLNHDSILRASVTRPGVNIWTMDGVMHRMSTEYSLHVDSRLLDTMLYWINQNALRMENPARGGALPFSGFKITPNHFNPNTNISFWLSEKSNVNLAIYNINGKLITVLANSPHPPGWHNVPWSANNQPSGIYLVTLSMNNDFKTYKCLLLK
jgi:dienelactone hydrolase